jgi:glycosyltransferase involved in cell wall biosynthesis
MEGSGRFYPEQLRVADAVITTIIPTFKRPRLLRRAINSVLAQSFKDVKIVVYDNASGDDTEHVVAEYSRHDPRIFYFRNISNIGAVNNIIQGVEAVTTGFYSILNDDDFILPDFYQNALMALDRYPEAGFVCAKSITIDLVYRKWQFRNCDWSPGLHRPSSEIASKMYRSHFTQTGVLLRTSMRETIGPFEKSGDDMLYLVMAAASRPFVVLNEYGAVFTMHAHSYSETVRLRGNDYLSVYEALLSTVHRIISLDLPTGRKAHLLMLATSSYGATLDARKLSQLTGRTREEGTSEMMSLPSRITASGILAIIYGITPRTLHRLLSHCIRGIKTVNRLVRERRTNAGWLALPEDAYYFCLNGDSDMSRFQTTIPREHLPQDHKPD